MQVEERREVVANAHFDEVADRLLSRSVGSIGRVEDLTALGWNSAGVVGESVRRRTQWVVVIVNAHRDHRHVGTGFRRSSRVRRVGEVLSLVTHRSGGEIVKILVIGGVAWRGWRVVEPLESNSLCAIAGRSLNRDPSGEYSAEIRDAKEEDEKQGQD
jgi:hypothetical protein